MKKLLLAGLLLCLVLPRVVFAAHAEGMFDSCDKLVARQTGAQCINKFGRNNDVNTDTDPEDVWVGPTDTYNWLASASTLYISSDDANDTEQMLVQGLNSDWELQQAVVTLSGLTFVELENVTWIRIHRMINANGDVLVGNIYLSSDNTDAGGDGIPDTLTDVHAFILAGQQGTQQTAFSTPLDHECAVTDFNQSLNISTGASRVINLTIEVRAFGGVFREVFRGNLANVGTSFSTGANPYPMPIPPKSDIAIMAETTVNSADVAVSYTLACLRCYDCNP